MSTLTVEERSFLKALGCRDKVQAVSVLDDMLTLLPVRSKMFKMALALSYRLKNFDIDFEFEMSEEKI